MWFARGKLEATAIALRECHILFCCVKDSLSARRVDSPSCIATKQEMTLISHNATLQPASLLRELEEGSDLNIYKIVNSIRQLAFEPAAARYKVIVASGPSAPAPAVWDSWRGCRRCSARRPFYLLFAWNIWGQESSLEDRLYSRRVPLQIYLVTVTPVTVTFLPNHMLLKKSKYLLTLTLFPCPEGVTVTEDVCKAMFMSNMACYYHKVVFFCLLWQHIFLGKLFAVFLVLGLYHLIIVTILPFPNRVIMFEKHLPSHEVQQLDTQTRIWHGAMKWRKSLSLPRSCMRWMMCDRCWAL